MVSPREGLDIRMLKLKLKLTKKQIVLALFVSGAIVLLAGIIFAAVLLAQSGSAPFRSGFFKVMGVLVPGSIILLGAWLILAAYVHSQESDAHFFRYDPDTKRNIPVEDLTFDRVNRRMGSELRKLVGDPYMPQIWKGDVFAEEDQVFGTNRVLAPLVAYKMLFDLITSDSEETLSLFTHADRRLLNDLNDELAAAGETRMIHDLTDIYEDACEHDSTENIRNFLTGNRNYLRRRMLEYAKARDREFY